MVYTMVYTTFLVYTMVYTVVRVLYIMVKAFLTYSCLMVYITFSGTWHVIYQFFWYIPWCKV